MYSVSEAYIEQMMNRGTRRCLSGVIGNVAFTGSDIVQGSFSISGRATEESDTKIGGVYLGELEMVFVPSFINKIPRDQYRGKDVSVSIGLWLPDEENENGGTWENVPCGTFTLEAPKISKEGIAVHGYDHMQKFDKSFRIDATAATPYGYLSYACTQCGVELGQTQEEIEALPNGRELLGLYQENDIETYRDLLYWLAQTCGCFACCDRTGKLVLRKFGNPTGIVIDEMHRDNDIIFSGYTTKWTGVSFVDLETQMTRYYGLEVDDGLTMNMGANPLLQLGSGDAVDRRRRAVLGAVSQIQYTPYYMNSARDPAFDLGDEIEFTGGISGDCTGCIMAYTYTLSNYSSEGYGDDPSLANARSKTDKNISGLLQSTIENEVTYYNFSNLEAFAFGSEQEVSIAKLRFTSVQLTTVKIMHEFIFDLLADMASDCSYSLLYYLDDELLAYSPYERLGGIQSLVGGTSTEASITRDFFYVLKNVEPNIPHTWEVKIIAHGIDSVTIDVDHAHVVLEGQRMFTEEYWDGLVEAEDILSIVPLGYLEAISISDSAVVNLNEATTPTGEDEIPLLDLASLEAKQITDSVQIFMEGGFFIATEDGKYLTTEDDVRMITEE